MKALRNVHSQKRVCHVVFTWDIHSSVYAFRTREIGKWIEIHAHTPTHSTSHALGSQLGRIYMNRRPLHLLLSLPSPSYSPLLSFTVALYNAYSRLLCAFLSLSFFSLFCAFHAHIL